MHPDITVVEADEAADLDGLERLAVWALRYAPLVAADPPDALVLDVAGAAHLYGGEAALLADLTSRLARSGIAARTATAETWAAARALAQYAAGAVVVPTGAVVAAVAGLPIAALRLEPAQVTALSEAGIDTIGELAATPRVSLALRFGSALTSALDRLYGRAPEFFEPVLAPTTPHARLTFAEPLMHATGLAIAVERLATALCADLEAGGLGARRLDLRFRRVDDQVVALRVGASRATRDVRHIVRLFGERLETIDPGFGVEAAVLAATRVEPLSLRQLEARGREEEDEPDLASLVDRVAGRIGDGRIYRLALVESDIPERSAAAVPALSPPTGRTWDDGPRPHRLFEPPEPIEVVALLPDHPPRVFTWRGRRHAVVQADGPESIYGEWWLSHAEVFSSRDYYRVQDSDGGRFWLVRANSPQGLRWYMQGLFA